MKRLSVGLLVSGAFVFALLYSLDLDAVREALFSMNPVWLAPALGLYFVGVWLRSMRWHYLLRPVQDIPTPALFRTLVIGFTLNNLLPIRLGEVARAIVLARGWQVPVSATLGSILVERFFDGLVLCSFLAVGLLLLPSVAVAAGWLVTLAQLASLAFLLATGLAWLIVVRPAVFARLSQIPLAVAPERFRGRLESILDGFVAGMRSLKQSGLVFRMIGLSIVAWLFEASMYYLILIGFGIDAGPLAAVLGAGAANLGTMIPSSPGYIGTFDLPLSAVLQGAFGVAAALATSYTLVVHATLIIPVVLLGLLFLARSELSLRQLSRAARLEAPRAPSASVRERQTWAEARNTD